MAKQYSNRSDLRNPMKQAKFTGQQYGQATQQQQAQQAVPTAAPPTDTVPVAQPGQVVDLTGATQRPEEPISAGANYGPGPGPEIFGPSTTPIPQTLPSDFSNGSRIDLINQVRYAYSKYPNTALFQLLLELEDQPLA